MTLVCALTALTFAGCSVEDPAPPKKKDNTASAAPAPEQPKPRKAVYLTAAEVAREPAGSPQRAVVDFWWQIQNKDLMEAYASLTPAFQREFAGAFPHFVKYIVADQPHWLVKPTIVAAKAEGAKGAVVVTYPTPGVRAREAFSLVRSKGRWLIDYNFYLANRLTAK